MVQCVLAHILGSRRNIRIPVITVCQPLNCGGIHLHDLSQRPSGVLLRRPKHGRCLQELFLGSKLSLGFGRFRSCSNRSSTGGGTIWCRSSLLKYSCRDGIYGDPKLIGSQIQEIIASSAELESETGITKRNTDSCGLCPFPRRDRRLTGIKGTGCRGLSQIAVRRILVAGVYPGGRNIAVLSGRDRYSDLTS